MSQYFVYMHKTPSGRVYVGISCDPFKRWNSGRGYRYNPYFWRAIEKYGWDHIEHTILYGGLSLSDAKQKEVELISKYRSNERQFGYNISGGGDGLIADESRQKMSESRIGNKNCVGRKLPEGSRVRIGKTLKDYYATHEATFSGRHHTQATIEKLKNRVFSKETRQKMSINHSNVRGDKNPSAKKVSCYTIGGELIRTYPYAKMAAIEMGLDLSSIIKCCRGKKKTCGGYVWKYGEPGVYGWTLAD